MKLCYNCKLNKEETEFNKSSNRKGGLDFYCRKCCSIRQNLNRSKYASKKTESRRLWRHNNPIKQLLQGARDRAKKKGLDFNIDENDVVIPKFCPVLGIELKHGIKFPTDESPTLDRIDNTKGYIKGNIVVVSNRANHLKSDSSIDELEKIYKFYFQFRLTND